MLRPMAYRFLQIDGDHVEVCDECGFHGGLVDPAECGARLADLVPRWRVAFAHPEPLLRARPEPETWCAVEYTVHTARAIAAIACGARQLADGVDVVDWDALPDGLPGADDPDEHDCEQWSTDAALDDLASATDTMKDLLGSLSADELARPGHYAPGLPFTAFAAIRHALHDAEHHLLDIRRGVARQVIAEHARR